MSLRPAAVAAVALSAAILGMPPAVSVATEPLDDPCLATLTADGGRPWRPAECADPGYANLRVPASPVVDADETPVLPELSGVLLNISSYAEPVYYASSSTPMRPTTCLAWGCVGGSSAPIRGDEVVAPGNDGQLVVVDVEKGRSYEMYDVVRDDDGTVLVNPDGSVTMGSMSVVDLHGRGDSTPDGERLNITGSGLSRIFGLIRAHEVRAAVDSPRTAIPHAVQVSLPGSMNCADTFRAPATKTDGGATTTPCVEEGARLYLSRAFDCLTVETALGRAVCFAMQRYGAYVIDNNGSQVMAVYGQQRDSWPTGAADYAAAGISRDYMELGLPVARIRVMSRWDGG